MDGWTYGWIDEWMNKHTSKDGDIASVGSMADGSK
jgi:hypothetical protein